MSTNDVTLRIRQQGAEAASSDLRGLATDVERLGRLRARPTVDTRSVDQGTRSLRDATRQSVQMGRGFEKAHRGALLLRGALVGLAGAQVTRGLWATANAASDLNEAANRAVTVFGRDGVREVQRFAKISSQAFGISRREFLDTAGTFGAMLIPLGVLPKRAAEMSVAMTKLAGDLSSFHNANPADVLMDLRSGLAGETEPLRKFGISLNDARLKQEALRLGLSDGKETLDANAKALAAYNLILSDARKTGAVGDFARTQGQLANQLRVAKAAAEDTAVGFGKVMLPTIRSGVRVLTREVLPEVEAFGNRVAKVFERDDLSPAEKWSRSWEMLKDTGLPDAAKEAIYQGMVEVGTNAPRMMLRAMAEAPWPAKAILGAMLVRRFGPVFSLLGSRAVTAIGAARGGGGAGGIAEGISGRAPVPVIVTNPGFGVGKGPGGVPLPYPGPAGPGGAGAAGQAARGGRFARYGMGAARFVTTAAGLPVGAAPLVAGGLAAGAGIGAVTLGGMGVAKAADAGKLGFLGFPSKAEAERRTRDVTNAQIRAFKEGDEALKRYVLSQNPFANVGGRYDKLLAETRSGMDRVSNAVRDAGPKARKNANVYANGILAEFRQLPEQGRKLTADTVIRMTAEMESRGKAPRGATKRVIQGITKELGELPDAGRQAAAEAARKLDPLNAALGVIKREARDARQAVSAIGNFDLSSVRDALSFSTGGIVPGVYRGVDTVKANLAPGERILRPDMVAVLDRAVGQRGAVDATILGMGGRYGGLSFAKGGVVAAQAFANANRGAPYSMKRPAGYFDCSSFAGRAALAAGAKISPPGSTATYVKQITPAKGGESIVFGFRPYKSASQYDGGGDEHMGIRINGVWWESGGRGTSRVGPGKSTDSSWTIIGVPKGLAGLDGGEATGATDPENLTPMQEALRVTRAGGLANRRNLGVPSSGRRLTSVTTGVVGGRGTTTTPKSTGVARSSGVAVARDLMTDTPDLSGSIDTSPGGRESLAIRRAGSGAAAGARAAGKSPEEVPAARKKAEDDELRRFYRRQRATTVKRVRQAQAEIKRLTAIIRNLTKSRKGTKAGRARLIRALRVEVRDWRTELGEVLDVLAQIDEALLDLDDQATDEAYSASKLDAGGDAATTAAAEERAAAEEARAEVFRGRSDASGQILRGISGSGSIDPGAGGGGMSITVNVGGTIVTQQDVGGWLVGILGNQPGSRRAAATVGA